MKTTKTIILIFCFLATGANIVWAQQGTSASGGVAIGVGGSMSYTVGQLDYVSITGSGGAVNQGVQQPYEVLIETGIGENTVNLSASVYPNPTTGVFAFALNAEQKLNGEITVTDVTGRTIYSKITQVVPFYQTTIDLSGFAKGIYFVQYKTDEGIAAKKISIE